MGVYAFFMFLIDDDQNVQHLYYDNSTPWSRVWSLYTWYVDKGYFPIHLNPYIKYHNEV